MTAQILIASVYEKRHRMFPDGRSMSVWAVTSQAGAEFETRDPVLVNRAWLGRGGFATVEYDVNEYGDKRLSGLTIEQGGEAA